MHPQILPFTGRWQPAGLTEGVAGRVLTPRAPSTTRLRRAVPLPMDGEDLGWPPLLLERLHEPL